MKYADPGSLSLEFALEQAAVNRFCPPDSFLLNPSPDTTLNKHIRDCPSCRERLEMDIKPWIQVIDFMKSDIPTGSESEPQPGQVWKLDHSLEGWDEAYRYLNSPFVVILEILSNDRVLVAQLYWDTSLALSGDVELGKAYGFAQPWNTKPLPVRSLFQCWGEIQSEQLKEIITIMHEGTPSIADSYPSIHAFRLQEQELLTTIAARAEKADTALWNLLQNIRDKFSERFHISDVRSLDVGAVVAYSFFSGESAAMAASSPEQIVANVVQEEKGIPDVVGQTTIELTAVRAGEDGLVVAGRVPQDTAPLTQVRVWWNEPSKTRIEASECKISDNFFQAFFPNLDDPDTGSGKPTILVYTK